jgi:flagellar biosynthesis/type III secretory pathway protein FliH
MRLAPLYERDRLQAIREGERRGLREGERRGLLEGEQRGIREGEQRAQRQFVENLLRGRFGELDAELATIVDPLLALPTDELTSVMLQLSTLSREELIARFASDN